MNIINFTKGLILFIIYLSIIGIKLTGFFFIVWLFCPNSKKGTAYLWSPILVDSEKWWPKIYWLGYVDYTEESFGSCSETFKSWRVYDWETFK